MADVTTVGALRGALAGLPDDTPLMGGFDGQVDLLPDSVTAGRLFVNAGTGEVWFRLEIKEWKPGLRLLDAEGEPMKVCPDCLAPLAVGVCTHDDRERNVTVPVTYAADGSLGDTPANDLLVGTYFDIVCRGCGESLTDHLEVSDD